MCGKLSTHPVASETDFLGIKVYSKDLCGVLGDSKSLSSRVVQIQHFSLLLLKQATHEVTFEVSLSKYKCTEGTPGVTSYHLWSP